MFKNVARNAEISSKLSKLQSQVSQYEKAISKLESQRPKVDNWEHLKEIKNLKQKHKMQISGLMNEIEGKNKEIERAKQKSNRLKKQLERFEMESSKVSQNASESKRKSHKPKNICLAQSSHKNSRNLETDDEPVKLSK